MNKIKILLVENHMVTKIGCVHIYNSMPELEVIEAVSDGKEALEKIQELKPDVILIGTSLPEQPEVNTAIEIKKALPDSKIIIINPKDDKGILNSMKAKADGYYIKNQYPEEILPVIKKIFAGDKYIEKQSAKILLDMVTSKDSAILSEDDVYLLKLMAADFSSQDISKNLQISFEEVNNKIINLIEKLATIELS